MQTPDREAAAISEADELRLQADALFTDGRFDAADRLYRRLDPHGYAAALGLGRIALMSDRLDTAEAHLRQAHAHAPHRAEPLRALSDLYRRRGDFLAAAECFDVLGHSDVAMALRNVAATAVSSGTCEGTAALEFEHTSPFPTVMAKLNDVEAAFLVDTGAEEPVVDPALATRAGIGGGSRTSATAAGGSVEMSYGIAQEMQIGSAKLAGVHVQIQPIAAPLAGYAPGQSIEGVLGMSVFYRCRTTLDFAGGRLLVEPRGAPAKACYGIPLRLAGAGLPILPVSFNGCEPFAAIMDSGQTAYEMVLSKTAAIDGAVAPAGTVSEGWGAGGAVEVVEGRPGEAEVGRLRRRVRPAVLPDFPLEYRWGFRIGGLVGYELLRDITVHLDFEDMRLGMTGVR